MALQFSGTSASTQPHQPPSGVPLVGHSQVKAGHLNVSLLSAEASRSAGQMIALFSS